MGNMKIYKFIAELVEKHIPYVIYSDQAGSVTIGVVIPGELWKIAFSSSNVVIITNYKLTDENYDNEKLPELVKDLHSEYGDCFELPKKSYNLFEFIDELHKCDKHFLMGVYRTCLDESYPIMIQLEIFDNYLEIEFFESGEAYIEFFKDSGQVYGEEKLAELLELFVE